MFRCSALLLLLSISGALANEPVKLAQIADADPAASFVLPNGTLQNPDLHSLCGPLAATFKSEKFEDYCVFYSAQYQISPDTLFYLIAANEGTQLTRASLYQCVFQARHRAPNPYGVVCFLADGERHKCERLERSSKSLRNGDIIDSISFVIDTQELAKIVFAKDLQFEVGDKAFTASPYFKHYFQTILYLVSRMPPSQFDLQLATLSKASPQ